MEPAASVIKKLGGDTVVAKHLNLHRTTVAKWKSESNLRGLIPMRYVADLRAMSDEIGAGLTADDFMPVEVLR